MFTIVNNDLLNVSADAICHQVNCSNAMGSGVAKAIYTKYPEVKTEYHKLCSRRNAQELLGTVQVVKPLRSNIEVVNIFGQHFYGRHGCYTNYDALEKAFREINQIYTGKTIAFPYGFGCGLAGGDWMTVEKLMLKCLQNCSVIICFKE